MVSACHLKHEPDETNLIKAKALLASRFTGLEDFKNTVELSYSRKDSSSRVIISYKSNGQLVQSTLASGITEQDIMNGKNGTFKEKASLVLQTPFGIRNRVALQKVFILARRMRFITGEKDVAFYRLAELSANKINTRVAFTNKRDSSEKGYINTFNHITAQAIITALFSEEIADYIADCHELNAMPALTTGKFTLDQLADTLNYPVDNYVDLLNNEIGQELGKALAIKYNIDELTVWSPTLLADFLNDIHSYYKWSFGIGMDPYLSSEEDIIEYSKKLNNVRLRKVYF